MICFSKMVACHNQCWQKEFLTSLTRSTTSKKTQMSTWNLYSFLDSIIRHLSLLILLSRLHVDLYRLYFIFVQMVGPAVVAFPQDPLIVNGVFEE